MFLFSVETGIEIGWKIEVAYLHFLNFRQLKIRNVLIPNIPVFCSIQVRTFFCASVYIIFKRQKRFFFHFFFNIYWYCYRRGREVREDVTCWIISSLNILMVFYFTMLLPSLITRPFRRSIDFVSQGSLIRFTGGA